MYYVTATQNVRMGLQPQKPSSQLFVSLLYLYQLKEWEVETMAMQTAEI